MSSTIDSPPPATNSRFKWIQILEHLFLIAGVLALGFYGSAKLYTSAYQSYEKYSFEQQLSGRTPSIPGFVGHLLGKKEAPEQLATGKRTVNGEELLRSMVYAPEIVPMDKGWSADRLRAFKRAATPSPGSVLGRLEIPSVDLSVMLLQGTDDWTLNRAVGHIEGTALPGQPGNLGVAGHRDGFFRCLKDLIGVLDTDDLVDRRMKNEEGPPEASDTVAHPRPFEVVQKLSGNLKGFPSQRNLGFSLSLNDFPSTSNKLGHGRCL